MPIFRLFQPWAAEEPGVKGVLSMKNSSLAPRKIAQHSTAQHSTAQDDMISKLISYCALPSLITYDGNGAMPCYLILWLLQFRDHSIDESAAALSCSDTSLHITSANVHQCIQILQLTSLKGVTESALLIRQPAACCCL